MELDSIANVQTAVKIEKNKQAYTNADAMRVAEEYEGLFFFQYLKQMDEGFKADHMFGGGEAEKTWRMLLLMEYGNEMAKQQGILKDSFYKCLAPKEQISGGNHDSHN
jgi:flagellar protein FlgJ